jgi:outer membrane protein assembly factor BamA
MSVEEGAGKPPPPVLVLHGRYGGCVGDLPSYDAFTLGGPYSVRGYNMGELGAARNMVEVGMRLNSFYDSSSRFNFSSFLLSVY